MTRPVLFVLLSGMYAYTTADCVSGKLDLAIAVDSSGSVGQENFKLQLNFMKSLISKADFEGGTVRVAIVVFNRTATVEFNFNAYATKEDVENAIGNINYNPGGTNVTLALQLVEKNIFTVEGGDRNGTEDVLLLLTDISQIPDNETRVLEKRGVRVIVAYVGSDTTQIRSIVSEENLYATEEFSGLQALSSTISQSICVGMVGLLCHPIPRPPPGNSEFVYRLAALNQDFQYNMTIIHEELADLGTCAKLCTGDMECEAYAIHTDGFCRLSNAVCNETGMTSSVTSKVYTLSSVINDKN